MLLLITGRTIGSSLGCPAVVRSGVYIVNEPEPDEECCSMNQSESSSPSQPEHVSSGQQDQVIHDNMDKETPAQEPVPVTQDTEASIPNVDEDLVTGPEEYETNDTPPEEADDTQPEQVYENEELDAPIAKQESVSDMQVPPPSPNEDVKEEEIKLRIEDLEPPEPDVVLEDTGTETKDDIALMPVEPQGQSTPKPKKKKKIKGPSRIKWSLPSVYRYVI